MSEYFNQSKCLQNGGAWESGHCFFTIPKSKYEEAGIIIVMCLTTFLILAAVVYLAFRLSKSERFGGKQEAEEPQHIQMVDKVGDEEKMAGFPRVKMEPFGAGGYRYG